MSSTPIQPVDVDVVIVGAGLSGLRAAVDIHKSGLSYVVLEAMDRVGGKTLSVPASPQGGVVDIGAAWINDTSQAEMYRLAKEFGFELIEQTATGLNLYQDSNQKTISFPYSGMPFPLDDRQQAQLYEAFGQIAVLVDRSDSEMPWLGPDAKRIDSLTLAELGEKEIRGGIGSVVLNVLSQACHGLESSEVGAFPVIDYVKAGTGLENISSDLKDGAQYLRNRQGNQTFSTRLAQSLNAGAVKLSMPVSKITQSDEGCMVSTSPGPAYRCKKVLLSVPSTLYPLIQFTPSLPATKETLSKSKLGYYSKTILVFEKPWWRDAGFSGAIASEAGPIVFSRDTCVPDDQQYSITCFHVAEPGRQWSKLRAEERREAVLKQFRTMFGTFVDGVPEPIKIIEKEWTKDPWARGAPSPVMGPGVLTSDAGKAVREPVDHIHFIGTETSLVWKGYMEGAVQAGIRGAKEVIADLAE
ncbi:putative flavin-containing monoamine oxidase A [Colletotrichum siamense]|uniref:putative flavin-containing monoamine oxidase A n=1 Tax=Colletotrichum siamense TaxID=690259 RepID=UPI0018729F7B|nr:putative flavin-containing monoamine oxidase A [Colletotrichum siamense]KAF5505554.1 putative flavin-containing monoamine oxidase A [Colletotrichum siamense]